MRWTTAKFCFPTAHRGRCGFWQDMEHGTPPWTTWKRWRLACPSCATTFWQPLTMNRVGWTLSKWRLSENGGGWRSGTFFFFSLSLFFFFTFSCCLVWYPLHFCLFSLPLFELRWEKAGQEFNILTSSGHLEHWLLGGRFRDQLSNLGLDINLEDNRTRVSSSSKQRARASAESFLDGVQGIPWPSNGHNTTEEEVFRYPGIITDDHLLRYYDFCPKYQDEVWQIDNDRVLCKLQLEFCILWCTIIGHANWWLLSPTSFLHHHHCNSCNKQTNKITFHSTERTQSLDNSTQEFAYDAKQSQDHSAQQFLFDGTYPIQSLDNSTQVFSHEGSVQQFFM